MMLPSSPFGEPGVHAPARPRRWDAVVTVEAPELEGDAIHFSSLPDGSLVLDPDDERVLEPLAEAVEVVLSPPYRAEGVRRSGALWVVGAVATEVLELREAVDGDEVELVVRDGERHVSIDGERIFGSIPTLERHAEGRHEAYVARAERLEGDLWEVEVLAL
ncbi:MAG TPA: hypothetical protein VG079_01330 [Gaiellaceae bacterium]|nr:hypothetical protein [Gaiellaceae bacterium]